MSGKENQSLGLRFPPNDENCYCKGDCLEGPLRGYYELTSVVIEVLVLDSGLGELHLPKSKVTPTHCWCLVTEHP